MSSPVQFWKNGTKAKAPKIKYPKNAQGQPPQDDGIVYEIVWICFLIAVLIIFKYIL